MRHEPTRFLSTTNVPSSARSPRASHHAAVTSRDVTGAAASLGRSSTNRRRWPLAASCSTSRPAPRRPASMRGGAREALARLRGVARTAALARLLTDADPAAVRATLLRPPPTGYAPGPSPAGPALGGLLGMPLAGAATGPPGLLDERTRPRPGWWA